MSEVLSKTLGRAAPMDVMHPQNFDDVIVPAAWDRLLIDWTETQLGDATA